MQYCKKNCKKTSLTTIEMPYRYIFVYRIKRLE